MNLRSNSTSVLLPLNIPTLQLERVCLYNRVTDLRSTQFPAHLGMPRRDIPHAQRNTVKGKPFSGLTGQTHDIVTTNVLALADEVLLAGGSMTFSQVFDESSTSHKWKFLCYLSIPRSRQGLLEGTSALILESDGRTGRSSTFGDFNCASTGILASTQGYNPFETVKSKLKTPSQSNIICQHPNIDAVLKFMKVKGLTPKRINKINVPISNTAKLEIIKTAEPVPNFIVRKKSLLSRRKLTDMPLMKKATPANVIKEKNEATQNCRYAPEAIRERYDIDRGPRAVDESRLKDPKAERLKVSASVSPQAPRLATAAPTTSSHKGRKDHYRLRRRRRGMTSSRNDVHRTVPATSLWRIKRMLSWQKDWFVLPECLTEEYTTTPRMKRFPDPSVLLHAPLS
ncbi:hypothetical protein WN48_01530 [Eufriesea mexicana]|nr:hypothetical protein WN48_01530 [Eufriesea mexicana]